MISLSWPQNKPSFQGASRRIWHKLQGNPSLDVVIVPSLKADIGEIPLTSITPLGFQTLLNLSQITRGLVQKTGFCVPLTRRDVSQTLRVHSVLENSKIRPTDSLNCVRLQDNFPQNSFSKVSTIYPSIGSGGPPNIPGGERVIAKRGHTEDPLYQRRLFLVPKKGGTVRPVIDLSSLNKFIVNEHFQMENLSCLKTLLLPGEFMTNIDLKDAYRSVPVHASSRKFLQFASFGREHLTTSKLFHSAFVRPPEVLRKF